MRPLRFWTASWAMLAFGFSSCFANGLFDRVTLSQAAEDALVAYFDARVGVTTSGNEVTAWDGFNGTGDAVVATLNSTGSPGFITTNGTTIFFDDSTNGNFVPRLEGPLTTSGAGLSYTIFWRGHYDSDNRNGFENSGLYAYNIGGEMSHQRDNGGGGFLLQLRDGSADHNGDQITAFDDIDTVWTTIYTPNSHTAFANGTNLNVGGSPNYNVPDDPNVFLGGFSPAGFNFLGQMSQLLVFEDVLSSSDIAAVESYLAQVPEPSTLLLLVLGSISAVTFRRLR